MATIAITGNDLDPESRTEPRFHSVALPVGQQIDDFVTADHRAVAQCLPSCPYVDAGGDLPADVVQMASASGCEVAAL